jgi:hypothetical protein
MQKLNSQVGNGSIVKISRLCAKAIAELVRKIILLINKEVVLL